MQSPLPRHPTAWLAVLVLLVAHGLLPAGAEVRVGNTSATVPFVHNWKRCVGSGHAALTLRGDWQEHLRKVVEDLGFTGVRFHGTFDDDMSVVFGPRAQPEYRFWNLFQMYDSLLAIGVKPIVELSFMPEVLASCEKCPTVMHYKGIVAPPYDFNQWYDLVKAFGEALVSRYGIEEILTWKFEVWNELWGVSWDQYRQLFNASSRALKSINKGIPVGGPATMQLQYIKEFVRWTHEEQIGVDFVSSHLYPTDPNCTKSEDPNCFANLIRNASAFVNSYNLPLLLTEYNAGLDNVTLLNNKFAASFVFFNVPQMQSLEVFSYWTFTDIFEEAGLPNAPFSGLNFGIQTQDGIRKPVYRAFEFLKYAGDRLIATSNSNPNSTVSAFATLNSANKQVTVFLTNFATVGPAAEKVKVVFAPGDVPPGKSFTAFVINDDHANPLGAYVAMGSPAYPTRDQLAALAAASVPGEREVWVHQEGDMLSVDIGDLGPYDSLVLMSS